VTAFLCDRRKVTLWIEASWLFNSPRIHDLPENSTLPCDSGLLVDDSFRQLGKALAELRELSEDLATLQRSWSHVLRLEPNEIWEPSIPAFTKSRFWVETRNAHVIRVAPLEPNSTKYITIQSQISDSGSEISLVKLLPPRSVSAYGPPHLMNLLTISL
jgi:hypothetical protein